MPVYKNKVDFCREGIFRKFDVVFMIILVDNYFSCHAYAVCQVFLRHEMNLTGLPAVC
jgi:hypothetical protein